MEVDPILCKTLSGLGRTDAVRLYEEDRDHAAAWYVTQPYSQADPNNEVARRVLRTMALDAAKNRYWKPAWAAFHGVLAAKAPGRSTRDVAEITFELANTQLGMHEYKFVELYLACAEALASAHPSAGFRRHLFALHGAMLLLTSNTAAYDKLLVSLHADTASAANVAAIAFKDGQDNCCWEHKAGQWIPECVKLAGAQLQLSLDLNRKLNNLQAVGFILGQLAEAHLHMGQKPQARAHCEEALKVFGQLGEVEAARQIRETLRRL
jgi:hypothetical protein